MNNIQTIDGVKLTAKGLLVKDSSKHWVPLHRQQGDMDGVHNSEHCHPVFLLK